MGQHYLTTVPTLLHERNITSHQQNPVLYYHGLENSQEWADEFVKEIEILSNARRYYIAKQASLTTHLLFRIHLKDKALKGYQDLDGSKSQPEWTKLKKFFLDDFNVVPKPFKIIENQRPYSSPYAQPGLSEQLFFGQHRHGVRPEENPQPMGRAD